MCRPEQFIRQQLAVTSNYSAATAAAAAICNGHSSIGGALSMLLSSSVFSQLEQQQP
jgi:hypothetical protein